VQFKVRSLCDHGPLCHLLGTALCQGINLQENMVHPSQNMCLVDVCGESCSYELLNLYSSLNIIRVMKSWRMSLMGYLHSHVRHPAAYILRSKSTVNASGELINKPPISNYQSVYLKIQSTTCFGPWTILRCCPIIKLPLYS
jgi:hypothetical protein